MNGTSPTALARAPGTAYVEGLALWTPHLPGWPQAAAALRDERAATAGGAPGAPARPEPKGLPPNERRRAPDSVRVALVVAEQAVAMAGRDAATMPSIFTSAHGDLPMLDALLRTLASEPALLSPMRFHHSVHNAPSGYWAMASASHAASTALAAYDHSFGAGLLEALSQLAADEEAVLLAGCDTEATGALTSVNASRGLMGVALVLAPAASPRARMALRWRTVPQAPGWDAMVARAIPGRYRAGEALASGNALADALPLFEALAHAERGHSSAVHLRCGSGLALELHVRPCVEAGQA